MMNSQLNSMLLLRAIRTEMTHNRLEQPNHDLTKRRSIKCRKARCKCKSNVESSRRSSSEVKAVKEVVVEAIDKSLTHIIN